MVQKHNAGIPFFQRLSFTIVASFILLCLIPVVTVTIVSYSAIQKTAFLNTQKALKSIALERKKQINAYFLKGLTDIGLQSHSLRNAGFMTALTQGYQASNLSLPAFVKSRQWTEIVNDHSQDLDRFLDVHTYYDIFLIDPLGNILYTVTRENDLGTNLFQGNSLHVGSQFSRAAAKTLKTNEIAISDFDRYPYSDQGIFGFMTAPVSDAQGRPMGLMAFQFPIRHINQISQPDVSLGKSTEVFLVGPDLTLRSASKQNPGLKLLDTPVHTLAARLWQKSLSPSLEGPPQPPTPYEGLHGDKVLGIYESIQLHNVSFGVIAEISKKEAYATMDRFRLLNTLLLGGLTLAVLLFALLLSRRIVKPLATLTDKAQEISRGDYSLLPALDSANEIGKLSQIFNQMIQTLADSREKGQHQAWLDRGHARLSQAIQGHTTMVGLGTAIITELCTYLNAETGAFYLVGEDGDLIFHGGYALADPTGIPKQIRGGQGLLGQALSRRRGLVLNDLPEDYLPIASSLGKAGPVSLLIHPLVHGERVVAMVEVAGLSQLGSGETALMSAVEYTLATAVNSVKSIEQEQELLHQIQRQHEELKAANEELEEQTAHLKHSQDELETQSEELKAANEELTEKTQRLYEQQAELEDSKEELAVKAAKLGNASQYKSEFLANMSHELRSPLNSLLILAQNLSENGEKNLTPDQVKSAKIIYNSGKELLTLINDILDLSKIEAGRMEVHTETLVVEPFLDDILATYDSQARAKGLELHLDTAEAAAVEMETDIRLLRQILNNFMSNAVKFTHQGSVTLKAEKDRDRDSGKALMVFSVIDTGIGIARDKQECIFDAFIQADGTTTRKYGGTGLGLSISKRLVELLKGDIKVNSQEGCGADFTIRLPLERPRASHLHPAEAMHMGKANAPTQDVTGRPPLLIIEDDPSFAQAVETLAREKGYLPHVSPTGSKGLEWARNHACAGIILDLILPDINGKTVLKELKASAATRHIPVHIISGRDEMNQCMEQGAVGYLLKPAGREEVHMALNRITGALGNDANTFLLVEDDPVHQAAITELFTKDSVDIRVVDTGEAAIDAITTKTFDCVILDLSLPDMDGHRLLETLVRRAPNLVLPPVLVYTAKDLTRKEMNQILQYARKVIPKGPDGYQRLQEEISLFLHTVAEKLPGARSPISPLIHDDQTLFKDKQVLLVDDDMRNIYAVSGLLQRAGMEVGMAENGAEALKKLKEQDFDLVLMDIMMPEMDGYEATMKIREQAEYKNLPIIALTAKAMPKDREKCLDAGANDYLAKPIDKDKLFSILKVWLYSR